MHLYRHRRDRIGGDRPQGVNIPCTPRRVIRAVSGDTLAFTANVVCPATREPVREGDLGKTVVYVALAENRFAPVIWSGSSADGWVKLDEHRPGLVHITVPRTVMSVLRRGAYAFSVVVDDGLVRETQLVGNVQVEYEPTGAIHDIPYRGDACSGNPLFVTPELDMSAQELRRITHDQLVDAVHDLSVAMLGENAVRETLSGGCDHEPTGDEVENAVHRLSQLVLWDDGLRAKVVQVRDGRQSPEYGDLVDAVCTLLKTAGMGWSGGSWGV